MVFMALQVVTADAQVPKKVMVEHFTNTYCSVCGSRNPGFYTNLGNHPDILHVSIHGSVPYSQCILYQQNPTSSNARVLKYSVVATPTLIINGIAIPGGNNYSAPSLFTPFTGQTTPISIRMEQQKYGTDSMKVRVVVKTEAAHSLGMQELWVGVAEDTVFYSAPNGESEHLDVFREQLDLMTLTLPANVGDSLVYDYTVNANANWDFSRMFAFAVLQNANNNSVTQAEATSPSTQNVISSIHNIGLKELEGVSMFPNPTSGNLTVSLEDAQQTMVRLFTLSGALLSQKTFNSQTTIDLQELSAGIYLVQLVNEKGTAVQKIVKE